MVGGRGARWRQRAGGASWWRRPAWAVRAGKSRRRGTTAMPGCSCAPWSAGDGRRGWARRAVGTAAGRGVRLAPHLRFGARRAHGHRRTGAQETRAPRLGRQAHGYTTRTVASGVRWARRRPASCGPRGGAGTGAERKPCARVPRLCRPPSPAGGKLERRAIDRPRPAAQWGRQRGTAGASNGARGGPAGEEIRGPGRGPGAACSLRRSCSPQDGSCCRPPLRLRRSPARPLPRRHASYHVSNTRRARVAASFRSQILC